MNSSKPVKYDFHVNADNEFSAYAWLLRFTQGAHTVLDIGCSTGFFSRYLVDRGCQVVGVESNPSAAQKAISVCHRVIVGDIETAPVQASIKNKRFDAVILGDVLEHLKAPGPLLVHIRKSWLKPAGQVVLSVPNAGHWAFRREILGGRFRYRDYGLFDHGHLRFFTRDSLWTLVEECGYLIKDWAFSVNPNRYELTFRSLWWLYRSPKLYLYMLKMERALAKLRPELFAYQFILHLIPASL
jgi:O-antigen biosynthesis protein